MPNYVKKQSTDKYENEFYPWVEENWQRFTGVKEEGVSKEEFLKAPYGIKRYQGLINFMNKEDWSERLPETREYLQLVNKQRGWEEKFLQVFPIFNEVLNGDKT